MAWEDYELAWGLLDVGGQEVNDGGDAQEALVSYAARGPEEAARAGLALAFSISEGFVDAWSADWSRAGVHLAFLERHGYVLSEAERLELDRVTSEEDADEDSEVSRGSSASFDHGQHNGPVRISGRGLLLHRIAILTTCLLRSSFLR